MEEKRMGHILRAQQERIAKGENGDLPIEFSLGDSADRRFTGKLIRTATRSTTDQELGTAFELIAVADEGQDLPRQHIGAEVEVRIYCSKVSAAFSLLRRRRRNRSTLAVALIELTEWSPNRPDWTPGWTQMLKESCEHCDFERWFPSVLPHNTNRGSAAAPSLWAVALVPAERSLLYRLNLFHLNSRPHRGVDLKGDGGVESCFVLRLQFRAGLTARSIELLHEELVQGLIRRVSYEQAAPCSATSSACTEQCFEERSDRADQYPLRAVSSITDVISCSA